jgi:hypothetical protein
MMGALRRFLSWLDRREEDRRDGAEAISTDGLGGRHWERRAPFGYGESGFDMRFRERRHEAISISRIGR